MNSFRIIFFFLLIFPSVQYGQGVTNESDTYVKMENDSIPHQYFLKKMGINPFSPVLNTTFGISDSCHVKVFITSDAIKDTTIILFDGILRPATYVIQWTGKNKLNERAESGLYFISSK
ncbi:MAG: hypothetical protein KDG51_05125 [Calditrichaeota bacterium]|nr:hypothetical protein [Calditrichota bacterium]